MTLPEVKRYLSSLKDTTHQLEYRLVYMKNRIHELENLIMQLEERTFNERFDNVNSLKVCSA